MAKVQKKGAQVRTKRRERKNIEKGAAHIRYHHRYQRQRSVLGIRW